MNLQADSIEEIVSLYFTSRMRCLFSVGLLAVAAFAQAAALRVSPDEAAKHVVKAPEPRYPELALTARIQGNVILEIRIDETGTAAVDRLVYGHPMLAPAAIDAVNQWRYQPFVVDGKTAQVKTLVVVTFGNPWNHTAEDRAEMTFQDWFWAGEESAEMALSKGDFPHAEALLQQAGVLVSHDKETRHLQERWQLATTMGQLRRAQKKYEDTERYFRDALSLAEKWEGKDSRDASVSLASLAALFAEEKKSDSARDYAARALTIFQKNFRRMGSGNPEARHAYGRAAEEEIWLLVKLAKERGDAADLGKQCQALAKFQGFLSTADEQSASSECRGAGAESSAKP